MRNIKPQQTKSIMADTTFTDSMDRVLPNSHATEHLCLFSEVYDEVIKMIIRGSSLPMRHISSIYRVNLFQLFDRRNLDPGIIKKKKKG